MDFFARKRYQKKKLKKQHFAMELPREKICLEETLHFLKEKERRQNKQILEEKAKGNRKKLIFKRKALVEKKKRNFFLVEIKVRNRGRKVFCLP